MTDRIGKTVFWKVEAGERMNQELTEGLFPNGSQIPPMTYKEKSYQLIKDSILYHRLRTGIIYSQDELCTQLGISRTPVREALLELQAEGYVSILRGRGIEVVPITRKQAKDIIEMRRIVEAAGSELAAERASPFHINCLYANLEAMKQNINLDTNHLLYQHDRKFHGMIFEASGNSKLLETSENLRDLFLRFETLTAFQNEEYRMEIVNEHWKLYESIQHHDPEAARRSMLEHLDQTYARTVWPVLNTLPE